MIVIDTDRMVQSFLALVQIDSVTYEERVIIERLSSELDALGLPSSNDRTGRDGAGNLHVRFPGSRPDRFRLVGMSGEWISMASLPCAEATVHPGFGATRERAGWAIQGRAMIFAAFAPGGQFPGPVRALGRDSPGVADTRSVTPPARSGGDCRPGATQLRPPRFTARWRNCRRTWACGEPHRRGCSGSRVCRVSRRERRSTGALHCAHSIGTCSMRQVGPFRNIAPSNFPKAGTSPGISQ